MLIVMKTKPSKQEKAAPERKEKPTREEISEARRRAAAIANKVRRENARLKEPLTSLRVYKSDNKKLNEICAREGLKNRQDALRHLLLRYAQP